MRKNGINRELRPIPGGICAVDGFKAGGVACGIRKDGERDLALIIADRKYRTACVFSQSEVVGAPVKISQKRLYNDFTQAILVNSGIANVFMADGVTLANKATQLVEKYFKISYDDVLIASTGTIGEKLDLKLIENGLILLQKRMGADEEHSLHAAQAITSVGEQAKQLSYAFDLGDFPCKFGVIFKGSTHVCPNMATTLIFMATDVNITREMLTRALQTEVRETLNMLNVDGISSPNDMVSIITTCRAGNCLIDCVDTEYEKFTNALRAVLKEVCRSILQNSEEKPVYCKVLGAKSKQIARAIAKKLAGSAVVKELLQREDVDVNGVLSILAEFDQMRDASSVEIYLQSGVGKLVLYEDERKLPCFTDVKKELLFSPDLFLCVRIGKDNFSSVGYGSAKRCK